MVAINYIDENEWQIFINTGFVSNLIINRIAKKIAFNLELTRREQAIRMEKSELIEKELLNLWKK
jgi:hypothetical protein